MGEASPCALLRLQVSEALPRDAGRGLARLDPRDMEAIGCCSGDVIRILGRRETVARVLPAYPLDRGQGRILVDGLIRENARTGLGETVTVRPAAARPAAAVILASASFIPPLRDGRALVRLLEGLCLTEGDRTRVTFLAARPWEFTVLETTPPGDVVMNRATRITLRHPEGRATGGGMPGFDGVRGREPPVSRWRPAPVRGPRVTYDDIGGLDSVIQKIREIIEAPLRCPDVFRHLGIDPPKGVLLHGPPGTGKTLIARAVAREVDAHFCLVNGPEIVHKFYGESEAHLRGIFDEARRLAPSVVFLDEVDAIAPRRADVAGEVEKRVVAQLLALMDGLEERGQVVVIGATNLPDALDPALRRPGRFDREIAVPVPDRTGRAEILRIHTRGMPLAADVDLASLAAAAHGFVGADLAALCREAAMAALRRVLPRLDPAREVVSGEVLGSLRVTMNDFTNALRGIDPSALREFILEIPDVSWTNVGGLENVKQALREAVEWPLRHPDLFRQAGLGGVKGILLHGPPGTGKTLLAKALARESGLNFVPVKGPALLSKYVGESERAVREVFRRARQAAPCMIFFDEIDSLAPRRGTGPGASGVADRVMGQFLAEMDGVEPANGVLVLAATNRRDLLDPALLRPGRFDLQIEIPLPGTAGRLSILHVHVRSVPLAPDVDLARLADKTEGYSGADLADLCRRAALAAIREIMAAIPAGDNGRDLYGSPGADRGGSRLLIAERHFRVALGERGAF